MRLVEVSISKTSDVTWNYVNGIIWSVVEMCVGVFCACLPVMAPLIPSCLRERSDSKERYGSSSFGLKEMPKKANGFAKHDFDRLDDGSVYLIHGAPPTMSITRTTDIDISEEHSRTRIGSAI